MLKSLLVFCLTLTRLCSPDRQSPGKREDPRAAHAPAGPPPGGCDQRRKGLRPFLFSSLGTIRLQVHDCCSFFSFSEKWSSLHQSSVRRGPVLRSARVVLPDLPRSQKHQFASANSALPDADDPPPAFQQPRRAAGGDQDHSGELLPAPQLEPSALQRPGGPAELGGESGLTPEPNAE